jgi:hypothetical protein
MRKPWLLLLLAPSALVYACGGDDSGTDGGSDAQADNTVKDSGGDAAADTGSNDAGSDTGPADAGNDVAITVDCLQPADCIDGGNPDASYTPAEAGVVCCGDVKGDNNTQQCQIVSATTSCKTPGQCATSFTGLLTCSTATVRLCEFASECTEQGNNLCCSANLGDAGNIKVCASQLIAQNSGGKISCN